MKSTKKLWALSLLFLLSTWLHAQDAVSYQTPPKDIADLLLAKPTPTIKIDSKATWMLVSERNSYPTVEELGQPEYRVAGLRLNPNNFSPSRQTYINNFSLKNIKTNKEYMVYGLPPGLLAGNVSWSPGETKIAFTHTTGSRVDLFVIDLTSQRATRINKFPLNIVLGNAYTWVDENTILYKAAIQPASNAPQKPITPKGPTVQQNLGKTAPSVTYQDLIKSPFDEQIFEFYATAQLIENKNGVETNVGKPGVISSFVLSPDKKYLLMKTLKKPFSYLVTAFGFPSTISINDLTGK